MNFELSISHFEKGLSHSTNVPKKGISVIQPMNDRRNIAHFGNRRFYSTLNSLYAHAFAGSLNLTRDKRDDEMESFLEERKASRCYLNKKKDIFVRLNAA